MFSDALRAFREGRYAQAEQLLATLRNKKDPDRDVLHLSGLVNFQLGQTDTAIQLMVAALKAGTFDAPIAINLGKMYQAQGRYVQAERIFERVLEEFPEDCNAVAALAEIYVQQEKWTAAEPLLQKLYEQRRIQLPELLLLAECYHRQGRTQKAYQILSQLPETLQQQPAVQRALGALALAMKQPSQAISRLTRFVSVERQDTEAGLLLAAAYAQIGDHQLSREVASEFLSRQPWIRISKPANAEANVVLVTSLMTKNLDTDEQGRLRVNGGHFLTRDLLDLRRFAFDRLYLLPHWEKTRDKWRSWSVWINTISDPDQEKEALDAMTVIIEQLDVPVINDPRQVAETSRDNNARRINQVEGLFMPKTVRILRNGREHEQIAESGFEYPFLLRETGTQTGTSFEHITSEEQFNNYLAKTSNELYAIEFVDVSLRPGVYRRFRLIFVDGTPYPSTCLFNDHWNVHTVNRSRLMAHQPELQKLEQAFLADPENHIGRENYRALLNLPQVLKLDYFGVDFGLRANDGKVVVFEANASINHNFDSVNDYPYLKPYLERITQAFNDMVSERCRTPIPGSRCTI